MTLPTDDYDVTEMEGSEKAYVERMRAAIAPGFMDALTSQLAALASAAMVHYDERGEEGDESEPIEIRSMDNASVWMRRMVDIAARDAYQRAARAAEERGR